MSNKWELKQLKDKEIYLGEFVKNINNIIVFATPTSNVVEDSANQLTNNLWLGDYRAAHDPKFMHDEKIKNVINATDSIPNKFMLINYYTYPIKDMYACYNDLFGILEDGADVINKSLSQNKNILVHCKRGHHRSASIVAYYLMKYEHMSLIDAILFIKQNRPYAFRRMTCMLWALILYEYNLIYS